MKEFLNRSTTKLRFSLKKSFQSFIFILFQSKSLPRSSNIIAVQTTLSHCLSMSLTIRRLTTMIVKSVLVTIIVSALTDSCTGFIGPLSTMKTNSIATTSGTTTSMLLPVLVNCPIDQKNTHWKWRKRRRNVATEICAQKKKTRFSQQGSHIVRTTSGEGNSFNYNSDNNNNINNKRRNGSKSNQSSTSQPAKRRRQIPREQNQPWNTGKSIDDLESSMIKKWGTLDDSQQQLMSGGVPDGFEIFNGDDDFDSENKSVIKNNNNKAKRKENREYSKGVESNSNRWARPVVDPWDEDEKDNVASSQDSSDEYYNQDDDHAADDEDNGDYIYDDENDEYYSSSRDDNQSTGEISGSYQSNDKKPTGEGDTYFFNPNPVTIDNSIRTDSISMSTKEDKKRDSSRVRKRISTPIVDKKTGKLRLLTIDEALRRFQLSVDEGTMEVIETGDVPILAQKFKTQSWNDLGITSTNLLENLESGMNCPSPLAVQGKTIPAILAGKDVLVGTYTGSGKTISFLAPIAERLLRNSLNDDDNDVDDDADDDNITTKEKKKKTTGLAVIIIAPGRELASQIVSVARDLLQGTGLTVQLAIGGTTFKRNLEQLRKKKPSIVVGTPGRIAELVVGKPGEKNGRLKINSLQSLVLDEFDALLEYKPHRDPTRSIMQKLKRRHGNTLQSVLCSATATDIMASSKVTNFLRDGFETVLADEDDVLVTGRERTISPLSSSSPPSSSLAAQVSLTILHGVVHVPHRRFALDTIRKILHTDPIPQQILIFVENARKVDIMVEKLADRGIIAAPLHGGIGSEKKDRAEVSRALREGYVGIVVATELAARGLDAPLLTHVINLNLPTDASHYAHRCGRCGRGGRPGVVINITTSNKERNVPKRFADILGVELITAEPRGGKLVIVEPNTSTKILQGNPRSIEKIEIQG